VRPLGFYGGGEVAGGKGVRTLRGERGQAVVELALVLPVILTVVIGVFAFGTAFNFTNNVSQLANEAARYAAVGSCPGCTALNPIPAVVATHAASDELRNGGSGSTGTDQPVRICLAFPAGSTGKLGDSITAVVETNYKWLPYLNIAKSRIRASATMRLESAYTAGTSPYTPETLTASQNCPSYTP
jgi:hypothetical protein